VWGSSSQAVVGWWEDQTQRRRPAMRLPPSPGRARSEQATRRPVADPPRPPRPVRVLPTPTAWSNCPGVEAARPLPPL